MELTKTTSGRPEATEFPDYQATYIKNVPGTDIVSFLREQLDSMLSLLSSIDEEKANYRYAEGKWSIKELLGHLTDTERVFAYRALSFARNDTAALPGFDENSWARYANHADLPFRHLADEFADVRRSTMHLFRDLNPSAWQRGGTANNHHITVRAQAYMIAGHTEHHIEILRSRYLHP